MKFVITVGREYGSGGRFIAKLVAEKLGIPFYDDELLTKAANDSGMSEEVFKNFDEKKEGILSSGIGMYSYDLTISQKVFLAQFDVIKKIALSESCVIVGRCADYVLDGYPNVCSVFICAPMDEKIKRGVEYYGLSPEKAEAQINKKNKKRRSYYNFYTDKEWGKASNYDLCINSKIGIDAAVETIISYIKIRFNVE